MDTPELFQKVESRRDLWRYCVYMLSPFEIAEDVDCEQLECGDSLDHNPVECQLRRLVFHDGAEQHHFRLLMFVDIHAIISRLLDKIIDE